MYTGTYHRLKLHVGESNITVIRATRKLLKRGAFLMDAEGVKQIYSEMLKNHNHAQRLFINNRF